jgi:hypothetical protein
MIYTYQIEGLTLQTGDILLLTFFVVIILHLQLK